MMPPDASVELVAAAIEAAETVELHEPVFDFKVRWARDYDSLFQR